MPSQLYNNEGISFVCARNFLYNGREYEIGQDFPQEDLVNSPEVLVRSRYLIPVVESWENKPRHWYREVQLKEIVLKKLGRTGGSLLNKPGRVAAPTDGDAPEGDDENQGTPTETEEIPAEENSPIPNVQPVQPSEEEDNSDEENVSEESSEDTSSEPEMEPRFGPRDEPEPEEESSEEPVEEEPSEEEESTEVENEIKEFDPKDYTVPEVNEYLGQDDISIDEYNRVIELEMDGKSRSGILNEHSVITEDE